MLVLGLGGTTRPSSSTECLLRTAVAMAADMGASTMVLAGEDLVVPLYAPGESQRDSRARRLVEAMREADAIVLASPGYHGSVSGLVKNALDYTEDMRDDARSYFDGVPVGLVASAFGWQATQSTLWTLRSIVHALRGWPTPLGVGVNTAVSKITDGRCTDEAVTGQLETMMRQVVGFSRPKEPWLDTGKAVAGRHVDMLRASGPSAGR